MRLFLRPDDRLRAATAPVLRVAVTAVLVLVGYLVAAAAGGVFPFDGGGEALTPTAVLTELPPDFPVPVEGTLEFAGEGEQLPYLIVWTSERSVAEEAAVYRSMLESGRWELMLLEEEAPAFRVRVARISETGEMTHWAMLDVTPRGEGSRISLEFIVTGGRVLFR